MTKLMSNLGFSTVHCSRRLDYGREKTVVDVDVTDNQKELVYKQLLQQQTNLQRKMSVDQQRQAEMVMFYNTFSFHSSWWGRKIE